MSKRPMQGKILYSESPRSILKTALERFLLILAMIAITALVFYLDKDGLRDSAHPDKPVDLPGVIYFTIVTITTLGYGDIVPVTREARLFDAIFVTLVRIITYLVILTTAFELTLPKILEGFMIKKLIERTKNHTIICGFGRIGREILNTLLKQGHDPKQIVIIDTKEEKAAWAAEMGVAALRGNVENEEILEMADIFNAKRIYLCTDQDHTNLMTCLTARSMSKKVEIVAIALEKENVKLFMNSGANRVINIPELLSAEMLKEESAIAKADETPAKVDETADMVKKTPANIGEEMTKKVE